MANRLTYADSGVDIDKANELVYGLEFHSEADSTMVHVKVPSRQLTINRVPWQMASEEFLSYHYKGKRILR